MDDWADDFCGRELLRLENAVPPRKVKTWTTKDGQVLKIKDMDSSHILNAMALVVRNGNEYEPVYERFVKELWKRGLIWDCDPGS